MIPVWFNGVNLDNITGIVITNRNVHPIPVKQLATNNLANADGAKLVSANYSAREIVIEGVIAATSRSLMEVTRDTLLTYLSPAEQILELDQAGDRRQYTATVSNIIFTDAVGGYITFTITFVCSDPFGYAVKVTEPSLAGAITTPNAQKTFTILGGYNVLPLITVTLNSVTGATSKQLTITNAKTGAAITIARTFANGDIIVIDCFNKTVKVNGTAVNYSGKFLSFQPTTTELLNYDDTFATRSVTLLFSYKQRWL